MSYQQVKRAFTVPAYPIPALGEDETEFHRRLLKVQAENYGRLAQEVVTCHNSIQVAQKTVAGAAATFTWTLPAPFPRADYSAFCTPDWGTTVSYNSGTISATAITFNFGTAAPGGGGKVLLFAIR